MREFGALTPGRSDTRAAERRRAQQALSQCAADHALLPALCRLERAGFISDMRWDAVGELLASCSTSGCVMVHRLEQFSNSLGAAVAAAPASLSPEHTNACNPIFKASPGHSPRAVRWNPNDANQLLCALGQTGELLIYDLGGSRPDRAVRRLRPSAQAAAGLADADFLVGERRLVVGGGRDGALRVWDTRAAAGEVVRPSSQSSSWTLGVRTKDLRAGAINSVAGAADGRRIYAATQEGCVLTWDVRALNAPQSCLHVASAIGAFSGSRREVPYAAECVLPHPSLPTTVAVTLSSGWLGLVDVEGGAHGQGAVLSPAGLCADEAVEIPGSGVGWEAGAAGGAGGAGTGIVGEGGAPLGSYAQQSYSHAAAHAAPFGAAVEVPRYAAPDARVRLRRPAWLFGGEWLCCARPLTAHASMVRLDGQGSRLEAAHSMALSAPLVVAAAHPRGHFVAVGLADNSVGVCMPLPTRRAREEAEAAARAAEAAERARRVAEEEEELAQAAMRETLTQVRQEREAREARERRRRAEEAAREAAMEAAMEAAAVAAEAEAAEAAEFSDQPAYRSLGSEGPGPGPGPGPGSLLAGGRGAATGAAGDRAEVAAARQAQAAARNVEAAKENVPEPKRHKQASMSDFFGALARR